MPEWDHQNGNLLYLCAPPEMDLDPNRDIFPEG